jgi:hypothetical protein
VRHESLSMSTGIGVVGFVLQCLMQMSLDVPVLAPTILTC